MKVTAETTIGKIVLGKGEEAGQIIDDVLCTGEGKVCCPGTSLQLGHAAQQKGKSEDLPALIERLNSL